MAKKNSTVIDLDEVFIEPSLLERLFPTFVKSSGKSRKKKEPKEKKKRSKKKTATELTLAYPIVNILPPRLMMEVKRKRVARAAVAVYALVGLAAGGLFYSNFTDITIANNQLRSVEQRLTDMTANYSETGPLLAYLRDLRSNATLVNSLNANEINFSEVLAAFASASDSGVTIETLTIASGGDEEVVCTTNAADPFADSTEQAPDTGCVVFGGVANSLAGTAELSRALENSPLFASVALTPGEVNADGFVSFGGAAALASNAVSSSGDLVDISGLPVIDNPTASTQGQGDATGEGIEDPAGDLAGEPVEGEVAP